MADIVLATLNARYSHASFGLRYLMANLGELAPRSRILEFDCRVPPDRVVDAIIEEHPRIVGLGVYIWNIRASVEIVRRLKKQRPDLSIVVGGPEVSYEWDQQEICGLADYVITNEADFAFPDLCRRLINGERPASRIICGGFVDVCALKLPYDLYSEEDIRQRIIYVEASRGCPFSCEFCLSSLDPSVRRFPLDTLKRAFDRLMERGVRRFKFVDRTFNLDERFSADLMQFFRERREDGLFLHFEMIPDRLWPRLCELIADFPAGTLQFEVGIQTFNEDVAARIRRRQDYARTEENLRWLLNHTGAYVHADLIAGLPGETWDSFARGFDRLVAIGPQEIQVNVLKRLRGTAITRHAAPFEMKFDPEPPYALVRNRDLSAEQITALDRFGRFWDVYVNSGHFQATAPLIWEGRVSVFRAFHEFSEWLYRRWGRAHGVSLEESSRALFEWLVAAGRNPSDVARSIWRDYGRDAVRNRPAFLKPYIRERRTNPPEVSGNSALIRQARRLFTYSAKSQF